ncbi:LLM class flavin-dependent oxidoreductase [Dactylosporangium sp. CA-139066]|uniref:LLM class flavin-dependent oxidoreductase n=1 Tax=Dactylosporangium sp. CA-139066 TaxID=3239930 RepID=UPI003D92AA70
MDVYSTFPPSRSASSPAEFRQRVADIARWVDNSECRGLLVYTDNSVIDPWASAQFMIERTEKLVPLVAAQPAYMHPYTAARMVSTIGFMFGRRVDLNLVSGGNRNDLRAIGCTVEHDARYERLVEYGQVIDRLLTQPDPVTYHGKYYDLNGAVLKPSLPGELAPTTFVAGSSPACAAAARALGVTRLSYPAAIEEYESGQVSLGGCGIRFGIIARETSEKAWAVAHARYPADRMGERMHDYTVRVAASGWHHKLLDDAKRQQEPSTPDSPYWLYPFRSFKDFCPYLVGSYEEVGAMLSRYLRLGVTSLIMGIAQDEDDLHHALSAIGRARSICGVGPGGSAEPSVERSAVGAASDG